MNLATWSIRNPIPSILLFALLAVAGLWGFRVLPIQNLPDLDLPTVNVTLAEQGAAPAQLETEVARKVEDSLATLNGLKHIQTTITDGSVAIAVSFVLEKKLSDAVIETKNAVDSVRSTLPADLLEPTISAVQIVGDPTLVYAVGSSQLEEEPLSWYVDNTVAKLVLAVSGVGRFERVGGVQREVRIVVDPVRMAALAVTATDVSRALKQFQQQSSGGEEQLGHAKQAVRTLQLAAQASDLARLPIVLATGREVRLEQVASVSDTVEERTQAASLDGKPVVGFRVYRARGFDEVKVANGVRAALAKLKESGPALTLTQVSGSIDYTLEQYHGSMDMLWEGGLLAIVVVGAFLRDWRATLIAAAALPLSILPAFAGMATVGYSLNTLTLLALSLVTGILVDDAIVEIENIERHSRMGKSMIDATEEAVTEIALAVVATTSCLVVVFVPTSLMSGVGGLFFREFGWTVVISVLASLAVARLLTPMMAAYFLKTPSAGEKADGRIMSLYLRLVRWCLSHRATTGLVALAVFIGSLCMVPLIPTGFIPASDRGYATISVELPPGSAMQGTLDVAEAARAALKGLSGVASIFTTVGDAQQAGGPGVQQAGEVRKASLVLVLDPRGHRPSQAAIENAARHRLLQVPGARFSLGGAGGPGQQVSLILSSDNAQALQSSAQGLERGMSGIAGLTNVSSTANLDRPEIVVEPNPFRAADAGVTTQSIGDAVRIATSGDFDAQVARLNLDNRQVYIRTRMADAARRDLHTLANLRVAGRSGLVPLSSVSRISVGSGPSQINRYDRTRFVTVTADLAGAALSQALSAAKTLPAIKALPSSVRLIQTGDAEMAGEVFGSFGLAMLIGVLCVYCVLVLLFGDFFQPLTILSAIPLAVGGALLGLLIFHSELDMPALIGLIMLMGIVTKNSILLVEFAIVAVRDRGLSLNDALLDACHKRARPIVMTTVAMSAGMLPIALGFGSDASFRQPMGIVVIGGLIASTALSLLVVPVVFTFTDSFERLLGRWIRPLGRAAAVPPLAQASD